MSSMLGPEGPRRGFFGKNSSLRNEAEEKITTAKGEASRSLSEPLRVYAIGDQYFVSADWASQMGLS